MEYYCFHFLLLYGHHFLCVRINDKLWFDCVTKSYCQCTHRNRGFLYQYVEAFHQDMEGYLQIDVSVDQYGNVIETVVDGLCQDFFEFREVCFML